MSKFIPASCPPWLRSLTLALRRRCLELRKGLADGLCVRVVRCDLEEARVGVDGGRRVAGDLRGARELKLSVRLLRGSGGRSDELLVGALGCPEGCHHL